MPVIKVWCLPQMTEEQLNKLHKNIVQAVVGITELGLKDESDMTCLFPPDMMSYGLGEEIVIEVTGLFEGPGRTKTVGNDWHQRLGKRSARYSQKLTSNVSSTNLIRNKCSGPAGCDSAP